MLYKISGVVRVNLLSDTIRYSYLFVFLFVFFDGFRVVNGAEMFTYRQIVGLVLIKLYHQLVILQLQILENEQS